MKTDEEFQEFDDLINELRATPEVMGRVEPPIGYEARLLRSLREKRQKTSFWSRVSLRRLFQVRMSWGLGGAMVASFCFIAWSFFMGFGPVNAPEDDLASRIAKQGGGQLVNTWTTEIGYLPVSLQDDPILMIGQFSQNDVRKILSEVKGRRLNSN